MLTHLIQQLLSQTPQQSERVDRLPQYLAVILEEYKTLRDEIKQCSINMFTSLQWGAAIQGIVISGAFTQWRKEPVVVLIVFFVLVPALSAMTMLLLLGEAARFKRAGDYIALLEQKIGLLLDEFHNANSYRERWQQIQKPLETDLNLSHTDVDLSDPLAWEQWLKDMSGKSRAEGHLAQMYKLRLAFSPFLMLVSIAIASYYSFVDPGIVQLKFIGDLRLQHASSEQILVPLLFWVGSIGSIVSVRYAVVVGHQLSRRALYRHRDKIGTVAVR